jgi:hypothetical protein
MEVYQIIFIIWGVVFAMWLVQQFSRYNKSKEKK